MRITFSDKTHPGTRPGWEDASRNTATFAVSREHRAGQVRSGLLNRTGTRQRSGREEGEPETGPHQGACRVSLQGGPTITKKDNAGRRIVYQPGRALWLASWCPCPGHRLSAPKKDYFLHTVQPPYKKFPLSPDGDPIFLVLPDLLHS